MARRNLTAAYKAFFTPEKSLLLMTIILSLVGLLFVFEASVAEAFTTFNDQYHFVRAQALHLFLGSIALSIGYFMPSKFWQALAPLFYGLGIVLLSLVFMTGIGREINGAHRWLFFGGLVIQPIEFVKFAVTIFFASWMTHHQRLLPFLVLTALPVGLVLLQPDLGSAMLLTAIAFGMYFVAGGKIGALLGVASVTIVLLSFFIMMSDYRRERVMTFINPELDPLGSSFHIRQITLALGRGGVFGQGIGNSNQKYSYIPEASTDSIFAIVAEEVGFVGGVVILSMFGLYFWSGYQLVTHTSQDTFTQLMGMGVLIWVGAQLILNIAAVVALVPLTGVPLPFFSYGGSSLIMILFASGLLLHTSRRS